MSQRHFNERSSDRHASTRAEADSPAARPAETGTVSAAPIELENLVNDPPHPAELRLDASASDKIRLTPGTRNETATAGSADPVDPECEQVGILPFAEGPGDPDDDWPWLENTSGDLIMEDPAPGKSEGRIVRPDSTECGTDSEANRRSDPNENAAGYRVDDESATEDLLLSEPPAARDDMLKLKHGASGPATSGAAEPGQRPRPELPPRGEIAKLGVGRPGVAPRRIGRGKLVPARLTWKPGDPFGDGSPRKGRPFRWNAMIKSACITVASGLVCVWLLHSILA